MHNFLRRSHASFDLLSTGSSLVDIVSHVKHLPTAHATTYLHRKNLAKEVVTGGAMHHLAWCQTLGLNSGLLSFQGADKYGDMIRETLQTHQINTDYLVQKEDFETTVSRTYVAASGDRCSVFSGGSMLELPQRAVELFFAEPLQHAKCVSAEIRHVPLASVEETLTLSPHAIRFLDLAMLPSAAVHDAGLGDFDTLERCIAKSTVVKTSVAAARELTNDPAASPQELAVRLREKFRVPFVALVDDVAGVILAFQLAGGKCHATTVAWPAAHGPIVDMAGADDAFFSGLIAGVHRWGLPEDVDSAVRIATLAASTRAACCDMEGALPSDDSFLHVQKYMTSSSSLAVPTPKTRAVSVDTMPFLKSVDGPNSSLTRDVDALLNLRRLFHNLEYATLFQSFVQRIITCRDNRNRVYTSGIGKSGIVAKRFASTLSSLSIPSQWVHGSEWTHGELGNLHPGDVIVLISNSGKTPELLHLPDVFHEFDCDVMCLVGNDDSPLYRASDFKIFTPAKDCLFDSVPARSIVAQEAVCNAVAESVVSICGIKRSTFKKNHPGGNIGKQAAATPCVNPTNPQMGK
ncbi:Aste57867_24105 [Aphanomyces stellatus]|uniref:Aste57867_24105 protein n=1 Tax=Aphanomyces stellatus TaxID=120398 RepID=A0A485LPL7_9STRA|nr:hypothetical protein As57867_024032 [Aphanomyces stellatus]VFU00747.1 Aste57867_24105 [Aphanomyces stellatus]